LKDLTIEPKTKKVTSRSAPKDESGVPSGLPRIPKKFLTLTWDTEELPHIGKKFAKRSSDPKESQQYSQSNPFMAPITFYTYLTSPDAVKRCLHVEIDLTDSNLHFEPGDALGTISISIFSSLGIVCCNTQSQITEIASRLNLDLPRTFTLKGGTFLQKPQILTYQISHYIYIPTCRLKLHFPASTYAQFPKKHSFAFSPNIPPTLPNNKNYGISVPAKVKGHPRKSLEIGSADYIKRYCAAVPTLAEILGDFPSCQPPLERLLENLPPLHPRYYSVTNSPLHVTNKAHIAFNVVEWFNAKGELVKGICTSWLEEVCKNKVRIPVFCKESGDFRLPKDDVTPIIMVGPGTGVAPFRGFLQHRHHRKM
jgi:sulfite reductase alpha subunit-like flavoprotein